MVVQKQPAVNFLRGMFGEMREKTRIVESVQDTANEMYRLARHYASDTAQYSTMSLNAWFNKVKRIPYRKDPPGEEYLQRPLATLWRIGRGGDCDDKAILLATWAVNNGLPFRWVAVGRMPTRPLHHILVQILINGAWMTCDATYPHNTLGTSLNDYAKVTILEQTK
jgi:transglutaminase-like putative cysteine protease